MNKIFCSVLISSVLFTSYYGYNGSTTGAVTLAGGIIKAKHIDNEKKYPRKNCPVCKGKGKYLSGDGIKMVDCGYCEPETQAESAVIHPPIIISSKPPTCTGPECNKQPKSHSIIIKR